MIEKVQREVEDVKTDLQEKAENLDAMSGKELFRRNAPLGFSGNVRVRTFLSRKSLT
ncbi:hypothetical protein DAPPUDRAFT_324760 [Daphnia pulex]|uniref:Uncharacterized protein n=1 Tax=Daphnia pulex TaxID=6669 RepID=E9H2M2_DAPPU|nr:hypothetical protein DAPPUDRAFT_324760 [Daphnia pulex]|eukprot:EFX74040.1 hypothetical protein DAPPUDRAFT_324760 [Daphnia pulex]